MTRNPEATWRIADEAMHVKGEPIESLSFQGDHRRAQPRRALRVRARTPDRAARGAICSGAFVGDREHDVAVALRELDQHRPGAVLQRVLEQLREDERERGRTTAGAKSFMSTNRGRGRRGAHCAR